MNLNVTPHLIYHALGEYIHESFFGSDQKGNEIFPLIDEYFVKSFCQHINLSDNDFIRLIQRRNIYYISGSSHKNEMLGFIGFQLYAASKMENSLGYSSSNYRDRICGSKMLNIDTGDWQRWASSNQDDLWKSYYAWCHNNGFIIANKCSPRIGKDRYVQYPKVHSEMILNREDLRRIATIFVEKRLTPREDISEREFWNIIGRNHNKSYYSLRSSNILLVNRELANKQIFQFYQVWDGEYTDWSSSKKADLNIYQLSLFQNDNKWELGINIFDSGKLVKNVEISSVDLQKEIKGYYNYKRDNIILFKKNEDYEDYWVETRYLENIEDEGIAIFINKSWPKLYLDKDVIKAYDKFVIVKINYSSLYYHDFYTRPRGFKIRGGMKLGPNTYLLGAPPLLEFKHEMDFWIDGKKCETKDSIYPLKFSEGTHQIKIKDYKSIEVLMAKPLPSFLKWGNNPRWVLSRNKDVDWSPHVLDGDVCGFDFEKYSTVENKSNTKNAVLSEWCRKVVFRPYNNDSAKNIAFFLTKNK